MSSRAAPQSSPGRPYAPVVAAQARLAALVESTPDAIAGVALDGTVTDWNDGGERVFGWAPRDIVGRPMSVLVPPELADEQRAVFERVLRGERIAAYHTERLARDGRRVRCSLSVSPLHDAEGRVVAAAAILRDETEYTEREAAERFLLEASARLAQSLDLDATIRTLGELAVETLADGCRLTLRDEAAEARGDYPFAHVAVTSRVSGRAELAREIQERYPLPADAPTGFARVIRTGESELLPDVPSDPAVLASIASSPEHLALLLALGVRSALVVPIAAGGKTLGAISLVRHGPDARPPFTERDRLMAEELGRRAGTALDHARAHASEQAARRRAIELQRVTAALARVQTTADAAQVFSHELTRLIGADTAWVGLVTPDGAAVEALGWAGYGEDTAAVWRRVPLDQRLAITDVVRSGTPQWWDAQRALVAAYPHREASIRAAGQASVAVLPLFDEATRPAGAIVVGFHAPRTFDAETREFLGALAQQCAQALVRARLFEKERQAALRAQRLQHVTARLNEAASREQIADAIFAGALEAVGADAGSLALVRADAEGRLVEFETVRSAGFDPAAASRYEHFAVTEGRPLSDAVLRRAPRFIDSVETWRETYPNVAEELTPLGFEAFAAVPVLAGDRPVAALAFGFRDPRTFDEATRTFLTTLGEQCALALERQRLHEVELERAEREAVLLDSIQDAFVALDRQRRFTYLNARAEALLQVSAADVLGRTVEVAFPKGSGTTIREMIHRTLATGESEQGESYAPVTRSWLAVRVFPTPDGVSLLIQDVTARRRRQEAASFMAEASRLLAASVEYERTLPAVAAAAVPRLADSCTFELAGEAEPLGVGEAPAPRFADGASVVRVPLLARGLSLGTLTFGAAPGRRPFDATDRALAEDLAQRAAAAVEQARLFRAAERARADAEAANRAKSQFLATMSHELRTPLNAIGGYAELIDMGVHGEVTAEQREALGRIQRSQRHLLGLINEVLNYARAEAGTVRYDMAPVGVAGTVAAVESLVLPQARAKALTLDVAPCPPELAVHADAEKLRQVLLNLLSNAVKFTDAGGRVTVSARVRGRVVDIAVSDTGVGIPADQLEQVFEPFVQVGRALNRPQEGTGLGLAISRDLARGMGGDLRVVSVEREGSIFTLTLRHAPVDGAAPTA